MKAIELAKYTHCTEAACEMRSQVVSKVLCLQQLGLDDVVEAELAHGDEHGPGGGPVGAVEQLEEAFFTSHADKTVQGVFIAAKEIFMSLVWFWHQV